MSSNTIYLFILFNIQAFGFREDISGDFYRKEKAATCQLKLNKDSTFNYCKRYAWCFEVTYGKWIVNADTLILSSITDPLNNIGRQETLSNYIIFNRKKLLLKEDHLIEISLSGKLEKRKKYKKVIKS